VATAFGLKSTIDTHAFKIVSDKLYRNQNAEAQQVFDPGFNRKADANWLSVRNIAGSSHQLLRAYSGS
jgi:hypothetical protein